MNRRNFVKLLGISPVFAGACMADNLVQPGILEKTLPNWPQDVPPLATWAYANGVDIATDSKRRNLANGVCKFPLVSVISMDRKHLTDKISPNYDLYRDAIRETNPQTKMLAHLNASESYTPSSPGQRVIHSIGGEHGNAGNEPENNPGTIWFENPAGHVVILKTRWGSKAMIDFRKQRARDTLFAAMETQYMGGYSISGSGRHWDGLFLDQLIVPGIRWGAFKHEQIEMIAGLQNVLTRFHRKYPSAIIIGNTPVNFVDINGEVNEGRANKIREVLSSAGHAKPEINIYMYKPDKVASEQKIAIELDRAKNHGAFFSYQYGGRPFNSSPWPKTFAKLLDGYPKWRNHLVQLRLITNA